MQASRPADEDRLPWLEPYRETIAGKRRVARRSHGGLVALAAALALLLAAGGGYWLGQRDDRRPRPAASVEVALPRPQPAPPLPPEAPAVAEPMTDEAPVAAPVKAAPKAAPRQEIRHAGVESDRLKAVRAMQDRPSPPRRAWPKMPSPGPAGQVIQLGAFTTPARANDAYRARTARYPLLSRMPRVVVPVVSQPGNRVLYVLRLGTASRQQSYTVCRNLVASGDHCLVIG